MEVFLSSEGKQLGPFALESVHHMNRLGGVDVQTLAWSEGQTDWLPLNAFLALHPLNPPPAAAKAATRKQRRPSRLRGLAGAFVGGSVGGALVAGLTALTGALFTVLWWGIGWLSGAVARSWAGKADQAVGFFAFLATLVGIVISGMGLEVHAKGVILFGALGFLVCLPGSLWLAFKTGSTPA